MIGNTDFSPIAGPKGEDCCHNSTLLGNEGGPLYSIPYDFDMSGLVNAPYAKPDPRFSIRRVTQRLYRGRCVNNDLLPSTLQHFRDKRPEIEALIENQQELTPTTRRLILKYVDSFYGTINNPKAVKRRIVDECMQ